jgi:hypothetical protein
MTKTKILTLLAVVLLLTNIGLLVYFLVLKQPGGRGDGRRYGSMEEMLRKDLQLTDTQVKQFVQLKDEHFARMRPLADSMQQQRDALYRMTGNATVPDSVIAAASRRIGDMQSQLDAMTFAHFRQLRTICTPAQLPAFDTLVQKMSRRMGGFGRMRKKQPQ